MPGAGQSDVEARILNLEIKLAQIDDGLFSAQQLIAGLVQDQWQQANTGNPLAQTGLQWAFLSISGTISAASGSTLGTVTGGTVKLATRSSGTLTAGTNDITSNLHNSAGAISGTGSGKFLVVGLMTDGSYSVIVSPC